MKWTSMAVVAAAFLLSAGLYAQLPDRLPVHWNAEGEIDGWASKPVGAFVMPSVILFAAVLFEVLPKISPRGYAIDPASRGYSAIRLVSLLALLAIHTVALLAALGVPVKMSLVVPMFAGALLMVSGNYLTTMPRNFFVGIRTPWTLASEDVWFRTHRLTGRLLMIAGVAFAVAPIVSTQFLPESIVAVLAVIVIVPIAYSYVLYRRLG